MNEYGPGTYGERWADVYDEWVVRRGGLTDAELIAEPLAELVGDGKALELAIGTGRIALPLARRGVEVHGVDASEPMVAKLREKPGGADIPVTMGDFAGVPVEGAFRLIYVVFNTFFALLTQGDQIRCFENVASHLDADGAFLIEAFVPDTSRYWNRQMVEAEIVDPDLVQITAARLDPAAQRVDAAQVFFHEGRADMRPIRLRFAWPSELDLMARLAGMRLRHRWAGWNREPFDATSTMHVSAYERG